MTYIIDIYIYTEQNNFSIKVTDLNINIFFANSISVF